jgi:hypothetical protein
LLPPLQCQPAPETDHLRHGVPPTSSCAALHPSAPASGSSPLLSLPSSRRAVEWRPGAAYSYSTRHISHRPDVARLRHPDMPETSLSCRPVDRQRPTARAETCATERGPHPSWPRCGQPLSGIHAASKRSALRDDELAPESALDARPLTVSDLTTGDLPF